MHRAVWFHTSRCIALTGYPFTDSPRTYWTLPYRELDLDLGVCRSGRDQRRLKLKFNFKLLDAFGDY